MSGDTGSNDEWWESLTFSKDNLITHEMLSQALWYTLMMAALEIRTKFIKHLPHMRDQVRQINSARLLIQKLQVLRTVASNLHSKRIIFSHSENFKRMTEMEEELELLFEKRYALLAE